MPRSRTRPRTCAPTAKPTDHQIQKGAVFRAFFRLQVSDAQQHHAQRDAVDHIRCEADRSHSRIRYQLLARLHQQNENWDALDAVLNEAAFSFPQDLALGLIASQRRSPTDAMKHLERLAEYYPYIALPLTRAAQRARQLNWEPEFHYYSGLAQIRMGGIERAKEHLALVASMDSPFAAQAKAELTALR